MRIERLTRIPLVLDAQIQHDFYAAAVSRTILNCFVFVRDNAEYAHEIALDVRKATEVCCRRGVKADPWQERIEQPEEVYSAQVREIDVRAL